MAVPIKISELTAAAALAGTEVAPVVQASATVKATVQNIARAFGGQLPFPASQSASADANTLDDYEEGTFTPAMTIGGSAVGITFGTATGRYTKIGRHVAFGLQLTLTSKGGLTGDVVVTGLPFAVGVNNRACFAHIDAFNALTGLIPQWLLSTTTILARRLTQSTGGDGALGGADLKDTSVIRLGGEYSV